MSENLHEPLVDSVNRAECWGQRSEEGSSLSAEGHQVPRLPGALPDLGVTPDAPAPATKCRPGGHLPPSLHPGVDPQALRGLSSDAGA